MNGAIGTAIGAFEENDKTEKAIILITDGERTQGDPMEGAMAASQAGVKLFCIGVGNPDGVPVPEKGGGFKKDAKGGIVLSRLDETMLKEMALATGGAYVRSVAGDMDLDLIYEQEIRHKMQMETISAGKKRTLAKQVPMGAGPCPARLFLGVSDFFCRTEEGVPVNDGVSGSNHSVFAVYRERRVFSRIWKMDSKLMKTENSKRPKSFL